MFVRQLPCTVGNSMMEFIKKFTKVGGVAGGKKYITLVHNICK